MTKKEVKCDCKCHIMSGMEANTAEFKCRCSCQPKEEVKCGCVYDDKGIRDKLMEDIMELNEKIEELYTCNWH